MSVNWTRIQINRLNRAFENIRFEMAFIYKRFKIYKFHLIALRAAERKFFSINIVIIN